MNQLLPKYAAALLQLAIFITGAIQTALLDGNISSSELAQLVALAAGAVATFFLPLVKGPWAGALKTGAAIVVAAATAVLPFLSEGWQGWTASTAIIVVVAVLNALATELGVNVRLDAAHKAVVDPAVTTSIDPAAVALTRDGNYAVAV